MTTTHQTNTVNTVNTASANLVVLRRFVAEVLNSGNYEAMAEVIHPGYRY